ncbi:MAG: prevent-host-death family protein [Phycisphaerae bacterium]|nr:prevent-host-death family protein [Phycisphaerae bacterium]
MRSLKASVTRIPPDAFNRVAYRQERVRVERRGGKSVYLVGKEDLALLERIEDRYWRNEGVKALDEFRRSGRKSIPWKKIKERLLEKP